MKKMPLVLIVIISLFIFSITLKNASAGSGVSGHRIIIDAGHGGSDPGTTQCDGLYESDANLKIANLLKAKLELSGATVYMTRTDASSLSNEDRYTYANSTDGEVLVSIHLNGSTDHSVDGTTGLYAKRNKDKAFTTSLHKQLAADLGVKDLGITNFASGVILKFNGPATIQETVYLSNTQECEALKNPDDVRSDEIAQSLFEGLNGWFSDPAAPIKPGKKPR